MHGAAVRVAARAVPIEHRLELQALCVGAAELCRGSHGLSLAAQHRARVVPEFRRAPDKSRGFSTPQTSTIGFTL